MSSIAGAAAAAVDAVTDFLWGPAVCCVFVLVGVYLSVGTGFFQLRRCRLWLRLTIGTLFAGKRGKDGRAAGLRDKNSISPFQALATALAATTGTGNIVGVATAIVAGGPGAVFWMWVSAFFGMMTKYAEIALSMKYRYRNAAGEWMGGPMVFLERGLGRRWLAVLFSIFCLLASFGIGNMSQANSVSSALSSGFGVPAWATGAAIVILCGVVMLGGIRRIGAVAEKIVPFMAVLYILGGLTIVAVNYRGILPAFRDIFAGAFGLRAAGGGALGYTVASAMRYGVARGIFSNEAGLGSSAIAHCATSTKEPVRQAVWGVFEVFVDTVVVCTITALCLLVTGVVGTPDGEGGLLTGAALTIRAFSHGLGGYAGAFVSVSIALFAFTSILGWYHYGERSYSYLFGNRGRSVYKIIYLAAAFAGCLLHLEIVWNVSDVFNGLMAVPNLIGVLLLSGQVFSMTRRFLRRSGPRLPDDLGDPR